MSRTALADCLNMDFPDTLFVRNGEGKGIAISALLNLLVDLPDVFFCSLCLDGEGYLIVSLTRYILSCGLSLFSVCPPVDDHCWIIGLANND